MTFHYVLARCVDDSCPPRAAICSAEEWADFFDADWVGGLITVPCKRHEAAS